MVTQWRITFMWYLQVDGMLWIVVCMVEYSGGLTRHGVQEKEDKTAPEERIGSLRMYGSDSNDQLVHLGSLNGTGVFDARWSPSASETVLGFAGTDGHLHLYQVECRNSEGRSIEWKELLDLPLTDDASAMCTTVQWSLSEGLHRLAVGDSGGFAHVVDIDNNYAKTESLRCSASESECWTVGWSRTDPHVLFAGYDDASLHQWDLRASLDDPVISCRAMHEAGIVSLTPLADNISVASGAYDDTICLWDLRYLKEAVASNTFRREEKQGWPRMSREKMNGGVWRIQEHPLHPRLCAVSCMYGGAAIVNIGTSSIDVQSQWDIPDSLTYGISWSPQNSHRLCTCTFYNHQLQHWHCVEDIDINPHSM
jgi:WD40 repeat protein